MAVNQHHDAVTGTEKQPVAYDYAKRLYEGREDCKVRKKSSLPDLTSSSIMKFLLKQKNANAVLFIYQVLDSLYPHLSKCTVCAALSLSDVMKMDCKRELVFTLVHCKSRKNSILTFLNFCPKCTVRVRTFL